MDGVERTRIQRSSGIGRAHSAGQRAKKKKLINDGRVMSNAEVIVSQLFTRFM